MSEPFLGEIRMFGGNFAPRGWAFCNGQLLSIAQNTALFSLLGTTYGGDGRTTFALPDLRGRAPMHWGQGPGLTNRMLGEAAGVENVTLLSTQMPAHVHAIGAFNGAGDQSSPAGNVPAMLLNQQTGQNENLYASTPNTQLGLQGESTVGGNQPHENMQPYLVVTFIIALEGIFPSRS
jgi:microcystin-dependent protein